MKYYELQMVYTCNIPRLFPSYDHLVHLTGLYRVNIYGFVPYQSRTLIAMGSSDIPGKYQVSDIMTYLGIYEYM